jgi:hypothetical protein
MQVLDTTNITLAGTLWGIGTGNGMTQDQIEYSRSIQQEAIVKVGPRSLSLGHLDQIYIKS